MSNQEKGKFYEDYIENIYRFLLDLETGKDDEPIVISRNVKLLRNGYTDEIDIYYEFTKANILHKVAIECKNYSTPVEIGKVRDFHSKIFKSQNITGVFISNSGFQSGAEAFAVEHGIILMTTTDLPNFFNLVGSRLKQVYLPNEYVKGEPFYILMQQINGSLTGSYHTVSFKGFPESLMLFLSKNLANEYISRTKEFDLTPRGLKQEAFEFLIQFAKNSNLKFQLNIMRAENSHECISLFIEPDQLRTDFVD